MLSLSRIIRQHGVIGNLLAKPSLARCRTSFREPSRPWLTLALPFSSCPPIIGILKERRRKCKAEYRDIVDLHNELWTEVIATDELIGLVTEKYMWEVSHPSWASQRARTTVSKTMNATDTIPVASAKTVPVIRKKFKFRYYEDAYVFMTRLGVYASRLRHHPRINSFYNSVTVQLSSYNEASGNRFVSVGDILMALASEDIATGIELSYYLRPEETDENLTQDLDYEQYGLSRKVEISIRST
ncbi:hypothetical protein BZA70DRAFT_282508 [Myxozyma melibiosi]|uniref:4a-hydroxytetrahydrobiopterin dehydratase n=1 Tax=Myxozyma melibiosi TaxID=54550 RepID=A0ABR1F285_9ASCO